MFAEIVQKDLILSQKALSSNRRNLGLFAPTSMRFPSKCKQMERSLFLIAEMFCERFFLSRKTRSNVCTVA